MKRLLLSGVAAIALPAAAYANCPAVTVADMQGVAAGAYPQQYDLAEFQDAAGCTMEFSANPDIAALNGQIKGNGELPPLAERLPEEPLVVVPYDSIGTYGGTLDVLSNATEAGTSDFLSVRHVNLVRYSDDLQTIVPNIAKSWEWNDDFTQLTFHLRKGHKWSDGAPFTSADVKFWHDNLMLDTNIFEKPKDYVTVGGETMTVDAPDETTVVFNLPAPKPGLLAHFATHFGQGFQPKHFLGQFHPDINADADSYAQSLGFENGYDAIKAYYGNSDWTDTPTPMLSKPDLVGWPAQEQRIRRWKATSTSPIRPKGATLWPTPISTRSIRPASSCPISASRTRSISTTTRYGSSSWSTTRSTTSRNRCNWPRRRSCWKTRKSGGLQHLSAPRDHHGCLRLQRHPRRPGKAQGFGDLRFREAMSIAINRDELNEVGFFGQGTPKQYVGFSPLPEFAIQRLGNLQDRVRSGCGQRTSGRDRHGRHRWRWHPRVAQWRQAGAEPELLDPGYRRSDRRTGRAILEATSASTRW